MVKQPSKKSRKVRNKSLPVKKSKPNKSPPVKKSKPKSQPVKKSKQPVKKSKPKPQPVKKSKPKSPPVSKAPSSMTIKDFDIKMTIQFITMLLDNNFPKNKKQPIFYIDQVNICVGTTFEIKSEGSGKFWRITFPMQNYTMTKDEYTSKYPNDDFDLQTRVLTNKTNKYLSLVKFYEYLDEYNKSTWQKVGRFDGRPELYTNYNDELIIKLN